ncbi:hypothetical protein B2G71_10305 [Novosphingobium sp. PC22D]|nr:hypothetical protein B2G71_10305 [Novosphingobium sp. PC22D]
MTERKNAPASTEAKGAVCLLGGDASANTTTDLSVQFLERKVLPMNHAGHLGADVFGEGR